MTTAVRAPESDIATGQEVGLADEAVRTNETVAASETAPASDAAPAPGPAPAPRARAIAIELPYRPLWPLARPLIGRPGVVFLDSGGPAGAARWRILGWAPRRVVCWPQGGPGAFDALRRLFSGPRPEPQPGSPLPFHGGWIGWLSYDLGRQVERLPALAAADPSIPDFAFGEYDLVLVEDRRQRRLWAAGRGEHAAAERRMLERVAPLLASEGEDGANHAHVTTAAWTNVDPLATTVAAGDANPAGPDTVARAAAASSRDAPAAPVPPRPLLERFDYCERVERIREHIRAGDIYQANFSYRWRSRTAESSAVLYERLRAASPAPFGAYIGLPGAPELLSISPELFLRKSGRRLQTRPIKGTRPRHPDPGRDAALRAELEASDKERAELLMITDLLRNDLGRVAAFGSVEVPLLRAIESHPTVHHAFSVIEAELASGAGIADLLAATVPGGSVTGAPKIRAMEILEELEPLRRGPYTGAAGFIGDDGDLCLNILIRTMVRQGDELWYQVGGGIVADSDPEAEYEETLAKGAAMRRALGG